MTPVLYITSSSYSGSTLLSFLLDAHPDIATVGEAEGWAYAEGEIFRCSCGAPLAECPLFRRVGAAFQRAALPFDPREFGTRYRLVANERLNRYLLADLPALASSPVEHARDRLVRRLPGLAGRIRRHDRANVVLARAVLEAKDARVFVDASKSPYRLRHLRRIAALDVRAVHLLRDPRGVVASNMRKKGYSADLAIRLWLGEQSTIARIAAESAASLTVHYEDLCADPGRVLSDIHAFAGVTARPGWTDYADVPHHILGNEMRLAPVGPIVNDVRWTRELGAADLDTIAAACRGFRRAQPRHPVAAWIARYGCEVATVPRMPSPAREAAIAEPAHGLAKAQATNASSDR